ncbi:MAG: hypothetical protein GXO42_00715 [bacterium]|nr:hypothetical protein [bacterium]
MCGSKNFFSWMMYELVNAYVNEIRRCPGRINIKDSKKQAVENFKQKFVRRVITPEQQIIVKPEQLEKALKSFIKGRKARIIKAEVVSVFPGAYISIGNLVVPWLENGLQFDVFSNSPELPASEVKGALLRGLLFAYCSELRPVVCQLSRDTAPQRLASRLLEELKGCKKIYRVRVLTCFAGCENRAFKLEVLCPHAPPFNQPLEISVLEQLKQQPTPIFLLSVAPGCRFMVYIVLEELKAETMPAWPLELCLMYLEKCGKNPLNVDFWQPVLGWTFEKLGLGAKTAYGYGKFRLEKVEVVECASS